MGAEASRIGQYALREYISIIKPALYGDDMLEVNLMKSLLIQTPLHLGRAIRDARAAHGLTQAQAAVLAGLSQPTLSKIESGASGVKLDTLLRLLAVLELDLSVAPRPCEPAGTPWED